MARLWILSILFLFLILITVQIYAFWGKRDEERTRFEEAQAALEKAKQDQGRLARDFEFYLRPENLEQELRARFNYKAPDEKTIILVPGASSNE